MAEVRGEIDPEHGSRYRYVVAEVDELPLRWATIVGDAVHNMRSALDHLVYELSFLGTNGHPGDKVAFPCSTTVANWHTSYVQIVMLKGVLKKHRALLYQLQPCYRRQDAPSARALERRRPHPIADLTSLWNDDKHKMLQPTAVAPVWIDFYIDGVNDCVQAGAVRPNWRIFGCPFEVGAELVSIPIRVTGPNPEVHMHFDVTGKIGLRDGVPIVDRLEGMGNAVRDVLIAFAGEFQTRQARRLWDVERQGRVRAAAPIHPRRLSRMSGVPWRGIPSHPGR
jgi:hypothetical protein